MASSTSDNYPLVCRPLLVETKRLTCSSLWTAHPTPSAIFWQVQNRFEGGLTRDQARSLEEKLETELVRCEALALEADRHKEIADIASEQTLAMNHQVGEVGAGHDAKKRCCCSTLSYGGGGVYNGRKRGRQIESNNLRP